MKRLTIPSPECVRGFLIALKREARAAIPVNGQHVRLNYWHFYTEKTEGVTQTNGTKEITAVPKEVD